MAQGKKTKKAWRACARVESAETPEQRRRNGRSATERICAVAGLVPLQVSAEASVVRTMLAEIRPAAHGLTPKTWANLLSRFRKEFRLPISSTPTTRAVQPVTPTWSSIGANARRGQKALEWLGHVLN